MVPEKIGKNLLKPEHKWAKEMQREANVPMDSPINVRNMNKSYGFEDDYESPENDA